VLDFFSVIISIAIKIGNILKHELCYIIFMSLLMCKFFYEHFLKIFNKC